VHELSSGKGTEKLFVRGNGREKIGNLGKEGYCDKDEGHAYWWHNDGSRLKGENVVKKKIRGRHRSEIPGVKNKGETGEMGEIDSRRSQRCGRKYCRRAKQGTN